MGVNTSASLFLWRREHFDYHVPRPEHCPVCETETTTHSAARGKWAGVHSLVSFITGGCPLCGWEHTTQFVSYSGDDAGERSSSTAILKAFDLNSPQVGLDELGGYLRRNVSDLYSLSPRRFEELTADVFRSHGFRVALTQYSRDGGADVLLLEHETERTFAIVECKRYARRRKVDVQLVRTLVGAAIEWDVRRAYLVTTSDFSRDARKIAANYRRFGYAVDLVAYSDLVSMLGVYNPDLPRLEHLTLQQRQEIIAANLRQHSDQ